jgi:hypothetical protein
LLTGHQQNYRQGQEDHQLTLSILGRYHGRDVAVDSKNGREVVMMLDDTTCCWLVVDDGDDRMTRVLNFGNCEAGNESKTAA